LLVQSRSKKTEDDGRENMSCWQGSIKPRHGEIFEEDLQKKTKLDDLQSVEISRYAEIKQELEK